MIPKPNPRQILITGTSRGLGRHLALHFLAAGDIVIGSSRSEGTISDANYEHHSVDLSEERGIRSLFAAIRKNHKRLDVLINSAAINPAITLSVFASMETISKAFDTNIFAVMSVSKEAIKLMTRNNKGRIINISSMAAKLEMPGESVYTATKAALNSYTRVLAKETYALGITVNGVAPSALHTDLAAQIDQQSLLDVLSRNAIPNFGEMDDVSNLVDFLISDRSGAITGQIIYLGGV